VRKLEPQHSPKEDIMSVIDTRIVSIENLQKKHEEIYRTNPVLAQELANKAIRLQEELQADMAKFSKAMAPWGSLS
jgi:hypothetical protein